MSGYTYLIEAGPSGAIKIGSTKGNPHARVTQLQTGCPDHLRLLTVIEGRGPEKLLHNWYARWRIRGEWFDRSAPRLIELAENALLFSSMRAEFRLHGRILTNQERFAWNAEQARKLRSTVFGADDLMVQRLLKEAS